MTRMELKVNGVPTSVDVEGRTLLVEMLREKLGLTGTHVGCDTSQCGACTIHLDGVAVKSCAVLASACEGSSVTTIEGISGEDGDLHPLQAAFRENHGLQCGYCTPGMIMSGLDILRRCGPDISEAVIREQLEGNLCRCTGYAGIVKSIMEVARGV